MIFLARIAIERMMKLFEVWQNSQKSDLAGTMAIFEGEFQSGWCHRLAPKISKRHEKQLLVRVGFETYWTFVHSFLRIFPWKCCQYQAIWVPFQSTACNNCTHKTLPSVLHYRLCSHQASVRRLSVDNNITISQLNKSKIFINLHNHQPQVKSNRYTASWSIPFCKLDGFLL